MKYIAIIAVMGWVAIMGSVNSYHFGKAAGIEEGSQLAVEARRKAAQDLKELGFCEWLDHMNEFANQCGWRIE